MAKTPQFRDKAIAEREQNDQMFSSPNPKNAWFANSKFMIFDRGDGVAISFDGMPAAACMMTYGEANLLAAKLKKFDKAKKAQPEPEDEE